MTTITTLRYRYIVMRVVFFSTSRKMAITTAIANPAGGREYRTKPTYFTALLTHAGKSKMSLTWIPKYQI